MCEGRFIGVQFDNLGVMVDTKRNLVTKHASLHEVLWSDFMAKVDEANVEAAIWDRVEKDLESLKERFGEFISGPEPSGAYMLRLNDGTGVYAMVDYDTKYRVGIYCNSAQMNDEPMAELREFDDIGGARDFLILLETVFSG